ncbi:DUF89 domain-containing protein [Sparassis latifolia]
MSDPSYASQNNTASRKYETVLKRWPIILTNVIDNIYLHDHDLSIALTAGDVPVADVARVEAQIAEGKTTIERIGKLKYEMARDRALEPIPDDGEALVDTYNTELARLAEEGKGTWFTVPWLYAECYLYRLLRTYFVQTTYWRAHDPFLASKQDTFRASSRAIFQLATTMHEFERDKDTLDADPANLNVLFKEMIQMCLWGNATDLSMLTHITHEDIQHLQSVGRDAQAARKEFTLKDDQDQVWEHLTSLGKNAGTRVDFILDNAGFELFTDFVFADFLVTYTPYVSKVVFHPKLIPWFVSDVTPPDFASTITSLLSPTFFPPSNAAPSGLSDARAHLREMVERWAAYLDSGVFELAVPRETPLGASNVKADFWTSPWPYWNMQELAPEVFEGLKHSGLVIFKGDLNFRKLTGDVQWPASTPFETAVGPLAGAFPILTLRTNKADVVVAVDDEVAARLDASGERWRFNGKYALVLFLPKTRE